MEDAFTKILLDQCQPRLLTQRLEFLKKNNNLFAEEKSCNFNWLQIQIITDKKLSMMLAEVK